MKQVLIIKHIENEGAGTILKFIQKNDLPHKTIALYDNETLPDDLSEIHSVILLGGPMNVYEEGKYPFLIAENAFIKKVLNNNIPFFGVCLGAQLLAKACGAKVYKADQSEIGVLSVDLVEPENSDDSSIFSSAPETMPVVQWHGDTFDLPAGARLLATSKACQNQAFVVNNNAYGLQFHVEVDLPLMKSWFMEDSPNIIDDFAKIKEVYDPIAQNIYKLFFA